MAEARIEKQINAPGAAVRAAITDPEAIGQWFSPGSMRCSVPSIDATVGGEYEFVMEGEGPNGPMKHVMNGEFTAVEDDKVAMTMMAMGPSGPMDTVVTFALAADDEATQLVLTQSGFPAQEMADGASQGWAFAVNQLAALVEG